MENKEETTQLPENNEVNQTPPEQTNNEVSETNSVTVIEKEVTAQQEPAGEVPLIIAEPIVENEITIQEEPVAEPAVISNAEVQVITETPGPETIEQEISPESIPNEPINEELIEEIETEPLENFNSYSKKELVERLESLVKEPDFNAVKNKVTQAREAFNQIINQEKATALSKFVEDGNDAKEFEYHPDALEERFRKAYAKYSKLRADYIIGQEKLREENFKTKKEILQQMKNLIQNEENMSKAFNEFHDLQARWRNTGAVPQQNVNELWMNYKLYIDRFYDFIKINRDLQQLDQKKNLEMKLHLCEQAEELILEPSLNKAINQAQSLQNKWKEIGFVSREQGNEVWVRFKTAIDKVFEHKKQYLVELRKKHNDNFEAKTKLCEQAETIVNTTYEQHNQWQEALKTMMDLQTQWRKIGPADKVKNEEVWKRFKTASDNFFKEKDDFYKKRKQEFASNLQRKTELCIQAEGLIENTDWKATSNELIRLQDEWKKVGIVGSQEKNNKIWTRFRTACDGFFTRKKAHFSCQEEEFEKNYAKKQGLIAKVEKFEVDKQNPSQSVDELKVFQREWSEIGMVPLKKKDKIWDSFRKAIQLHFDALQVRPDFRQGFGRDNKDAQSNKTYNATDERNIVFKMNKLKEEVSQLENNIEFFAKSKSTNIIKQQYEQKIQDSKDEIEKLKARLKEIKSAN